MTYILPQFGSNIKCFDMKDTISTLLGLVWQLSDSDLLKNVYEIRHLEKRRCHVLKRQTLTREQLCFDIFVWCDKYVLLLYRETARLFKT